MRETCKGCIYYRPLAHIDADRVCHFMIDTGEKRGCPAAECTRYTKGEKTMSKCIYKTAEGYYTIHSDGIDIREYCVEGPCGDEEAEERRDEK